MLKNNYILYFKNMFMFNFYVYQFMNTTKIILQSNPGVNLLLKRNIENLKNHPVL